MTTLREVLSAIEALDNQRRTMGAELRELLSANPESLPAEAEQRSQQIETEVAALREEETKLQATARRMALADELARTAPAAPLDPTHRETRGTQRDLRPGEVVGLRPEQRMADFIGKPAEPLSLGRMIRGHLLGEWSGAEAERRAMGESTGAAGGFFVPDQVSAMTIDLVRNATVLVRGGALTVPVGPGTTTFVKVLSDPTAQFREEHEEISASDGTYGAVTARPVSIAAKVVVSTELLEDVPTFAGQIEAQIGAALGLEVDRVGLFGSGASSEPLGLYSVTGPTDISMGGNGGALTSYDVFLDAIAAIEALNGKPSAVVYSPRTKRALAGLVTGISGDKTKLVPPAEFTALTRLVSNQVPNTLTQGSASNASVAFVGDFSQMAIAVRSSLIIEASRTAGDAFAKAEVHVRALMRCDIVHLRPTFFARIKGITP